MPPRKRQTKNKTTLTDEHKDALAEGRRQGNAVRRYLEALEVSKPRRGRQVSTESLSARRDEIDAKIATADPLKKAHLIQQRRDLDRRLSTSGETEEVDIEALEDAFVLVAAEYGARKGIEYKTWREVGVPANVLARAGIHWSRR
jgi:seryl-tRNA synthetase